MTNSFWEQTELNLEEKILSLLACHDVISLKELTDKYQVSDYFETAKVLENLIEKKYVEPLGNGIFQIFDSQEGLSLKYSLRRKIVYNLENILLEVNDNINNINYSFDLFSCINRLWEKWLNEDFSLVYSTTRKKVQEKLKSRIFQ